MSETEQNTLARQAEADSRSSQAHDQAEGRCTAPASACIAASRAREFLVDSPLLSPAALEKKHRLENDPSSRADHMAYLPGMEQIDSAIKDQVLAAMDSFDPARYTERDVRRALDARVCSVEDFKALLSPAAAPFLEEMARRAEEITRRHFGNTVYIFTPLYIANYCQNYCVYCGFNCYNQIRRKQLSMEEIEHEMSVIAQTGME